VICQTLVPKKDQTGRMVAVEVMVPNAAIRNLIRENKLHQVQSAMLVGQEQSGMITLNQSLAYLVGEGLVNESEAVSATPDPGDLLRLLTAPERRAS
jgi:twitching motility protein PilT